jgi:peptidylprolyl isomerase
MNTIFKRIFALNILFLAFSCNTPVGNENTLITVNTTLGDITLRLYDGTPIHRDNFIKLVRSGFYEGVSFHRIIEEFMIQGGDVATRTSKEGLHDSLSTYTIPAEIRSEYFHKKGALAAARQGNDINPDMRSSGTQFYIVQGKKLTDPEIDDMEQRINSNLKQALFNKLLKATSDSAQVSGKPLTAGEIQEIAAMKMFNYLSTNKDFKVPEEQRVIYSTLGGVPRLDGTYTVFGEVVKGLDVVDKIAAVQTDATDRPVNDVKILKMRIEKK